MGNYKEMSRQAIQCLGGKENIAHVAHCATRLRIDVIDKNLVNIAGLKELPDCAGAFDKLNQIQIIIGPKVNDAYNDFMDVAGYTHNNENGQRHVVTDNSKKNATYYMNKFGNFVAPIFMPAVPALIVGGMILAIRNLLINYFGMEVDGGTAGIFFAIFEAAFIFLPIYIGYNLANQLKMQPIMGAFLGAVMLTNSIDNVEGLSFLGIAIPQISYGSTIFPVVLGIFFMFYVDKILKKIIPEALVYFVKPLLTMLIVVPVQLIILGPLGLHLSIEIGRFCIWLGETVGFICQPILAAVYPYMVMLGIDKAIQPISIHLIATEGYNIITGSMGFISNISIGATALAVATSIKDNKAKRGMTTSFGITALCGVTEPAFYGCLILNPKLLIGTALGAISGGLVAGIMGLRSFVEGGCPGLLTLLFYVDQNGGLHYVYIAILVAAVSIFVAYFSTKYILSKDNSNHMNKLAESMS